MKSSGPKRLPATYYYAEDRRVPIKFDKEQVAVDLTQDLEGPLGETWRRVRSRAKALPGKVGIIQKNQLPAALRRALEEAGALHPVYRHGDTTLVALPEVHVEIDPADRSALLSSIKKGPVPAKIERDDGDQLVLRPQTGRGADALSLANFVHERVPTKMSQARFVRITTAPGVTGRAR